MFNRLLRFALEFKLGECSLDQLVGNQLVRSGTVSTVDKTKDIATYRVCCFPSSVEKMRSSEKIESTEVEKCFFGPTPINSTTKQGPDFNISSGRVIYRPNNVFYKS
jgi:hypothetical protein